MSLKDAVGVVYLIHFDSPYHHARHYLGWTEDLPVRMKAHRSGGGSRLIRAVNKAGIGWRISRAWEGTKSLERSLKNRHGAPRLCPICKGRVFVEGEEIEIERANISPGCDQ